MAYTALPTVATGDTLTAAQWNLWVKDNLSSLWPGTAAGDIDYYDSATTKAKLAKPSVDAVLKSTSAGVPSWDALSNYFRPTRRMGGNASLWNIGGTTNYDFPANVKFQCGVARVTFSNSSSQGQTITFEIAYSEKPLVVVGQPAFIGGNPNVYFTSHTPSATTLNVAASLTANYTGTLDFPWLAIGPVA